MTNEINLTWEELSIILMMAQDKVWDDDLTKDQFQMANGRIAKLRLYSDSKSGPINIVEDNDAFKRLAESQVQNDFSPKKERLTPYPFLYCVICFTFFTAGFLMGVF